MQAKCSCREGVDSSIYNGESTDMLHCFILQYTDTRSKESKKKKKQTQTNDNSYKEERWGCQSSRPHSQAKKKKNDTYYEGEYSRDMSEKEREREWRKK